MAKKYLDYDGLKYLWSKINGKVDEVTEYEIVRITLSTDVGGGLYNCNSNR